MYSILMSWGWTLLLGALAAAPPADTWTLPLLWQTDVETYLESCPTVADLDGDGYSEVILAGREDLIALNGEGRELWRWRAPGRYMTYPSVLMRPNGSPLLYAADTSGVLTCLDAAGTLVWQAQLNGPAEWSAAVVCQLTPEQKFTVIQTDTKGTVWAFDALSGAIKWKSTVEGAPVSPAVGDVNGDGRMEIAVATGAGELFLLNSAGEILWKRPLDGPSQSWSTSAPVMLSGPDGLGLIVAGSSDGRVFCFSAEGTPMWTQHLKGPIASGISVADIDGTGVLDIFVVTQLGFLYRLDPEGTIRWEIDTQGRSLAAGAIVDVNGDGRLEYVLCTQNGHLMVFDNRGDVLFEHQFDHRTINVTPTFADVTPQSPGLEMVLSGGEAGLALCFATSGPNEAPAPWPAYRANVQKHGSQLGPTPAMHHAMRPLNLRAPQILAGEPIRFQIDRTGSADDELVAVATCVYPDGRRQVARTPILGPKAELRLNLEPFMAGTYHFSWSLSKDHAAIDRGETIVQLAPFANERALAERALTALSETADALEGGFPSPARALRGEVMKLEQDRDTLDEVVKLEPAETTEQLEVAGRLVRRARRGLRVANVVGQACQSGDGTGLVVFEGVLWESRDIVNALPDAVASPLSVQRRVLPGEHDPLSLRLFNTTNGELLVRVQAEADQPDVSVQVLHSVPSPTAAGHLAWDALPPLDASNVLSVPPLSTREVWIDVAFAAETEGMRTLKVHFQVLNAPSVMALKAPHTMAPPEWLVQADYALLPMAMAPSTSLRLCTWASLDKYNAPDLLFHGNNVFVVPHGAPKFVDGQDTMDIDFSALDALIRLVQNQDAYLLLNGVPNLRGSLGSETYVNDLRTFLPREQEHLSQMGFPPGSYALYPVDEPGGIGWAAVNTVVEFGKAVRQVDPEIPIYIDGGGELPMFEAMDPYVDIWCPGIYMLVEETPLMNFVRDTGEALWTYNCSYGFARPTGPNIKDINIVGEFRTQALFAMRHGATGIGYWCYNIGDDMWTRTEFEYPLVYPGENGPITSRRWEAVREGIEDYRILQALKDRMSNTAGEPVPDKLRERIQALTSERLTALVDQGYTEMIRGLARYMLDQSISEETLAVFRKEMLDCVEALTSADQRSSN